jgi:hypothetical protein
MSELVELEVPHHVAVFVTWHLDDETMTTP